MVRIVGRQDLEVEVAQLPGVEVEVEDIVEVEVLTVEVVVEPMLPVLADDHLTMVATK